MSTTGRSHTRPPTFESLFADPRHFRGDLRLMRTAIRRGWLDNAAPADRDALVARFRRSLTALLAHECEGTRDRLVLAAVEVMLEMERATLATVRSVVREAIATSKAARPS